jgi:DNA-binding transcriptional ArsR family regulator
MEPCQSPLDFLTPVSNYLHVTDEGGSPGDRLLATLAALANPHRLRVVAALAAGGRNYVSQLARDLGISRPLLHLHLARLEEAGLVVSRLELTDDGKARNYFDVSDFAIELTPAAIAEAAPTLTTRPDK